MINVKWTQLTTQFWHSDYTVLETKIGIYSIKEILIIINPMYHKSARIMRNLW